MGEGKKSARERERKRKRKGEGDKDKEGETLVRMNQVVVVCWVLTT